MLFGHLNQTDDNYQKNTSKNGAVIYCVSAETPQGDFSKHTQASKFDEFAKCFEF